MLKKMKVIYCFTHLRDNLLTNILIGFLLFFFYFTVPGANGPSPGERSSFLIILFAFIQQNDLCNLISFLPM